MPKKELRLGLVCYGGVSLAIYIHGVTKEIHKWVMASKGFEDNPEANPFSDKQVEHVYWKVLKKVQEATGVQLRVIVDVISGNSAGGINGIFLAKALAQGLSQDALRDIWMERGDLEELMEGESPLKYGITTVLRGILPGVDMEPPLNGNLMLNWLNEALGKMDASPGVNPTSALIPNHQTLNLFVTTTDFNGYSILVPMSDPKSIQDREHRVMIPFQHGAGKQQFTSEYNSALTFSARATSSFPGAFPPLQLSHLSDAEAGMQPIPIEQYKEFFRHYQLYGSDAHPEKAVFVDGGVLDNAPFSYTIKAIIEKPASYQVDRRLIYIQPDPGGKPKQAPEEESEAYWDSMDYLYDKPKPSHRPSVPKEKGVPTLAKTVWGALSGIPGHQPIHGDIMKVLEFNERVRRINSIVTSCYDYVTQSLESHIDPNLGDIGANFTDTNIAQWRETINQHARESNGLAFNSYAKLKLNSVVDHLAETVNGICDFPVESNHARFVRYVFNRWATQGGLISQEGALSGTQIEFLKNFDLMYSQRRIRFVIQQVNQLYEDKSDSAPSRADLNQVKQALYGFILQVREAQALLNADASLKTRIQNFFSEKTITDVFAQVSRNKLGFDDFVEKFVDAGAEPLSDLVDSIGEHYEQRLNSFRGDLFAAFQSLTHNWADAYKKKLMVRYLGFPYWDIMIYPLKLLSDVGELDEIEVIRMSPLETNYLSDEGTGKLQGVGVGHFKAFFKREYRENDYLWGRFDMAERAIRLIFGEVDGVSEQETRQLCKEAFEAIAEEEASYFGRGNESLMAIVERIKAFQP